jgi:Flp pilus assembly protein TadG
MRRRLASRVIGRLAAFLGSAGDAGNVAVEYALTAPYLLAFCYGLMEVSHFAYIQLTLSDVAHDSVRYAVVHGSNSSQPLQASDISTYATNEMTSLSLSTAPATVTVTYNPNNSPGSTVSVSISYVFTPFMPGFNQIPGMTTTFTSLVGPVTASAQMVVGP